MTRLHSPDEAGRKALRIAAMLGHFPQQEQDPAVSRMIGEDYLKALKGIPAYAVEAGVENLLMKNSKRRPTIGAVQDSCKSACLRYRELKDYLKRLIEQEKNL